jgi:hypothetical protein
MPAVLTPTAPQISSRFGQVHVELAAAEAKWGSLAGAVARRRDAKFAKHMTSGALEFATDPDNWAIVGGHHVEESRARALATAARLDALDNGPISEAKQRLAAARAQQRVLDAFAGMRATDAECAEIRQQLAAEADWV